MLVPPGVHLPMKKILLIATGGTIACKRTGAGLTPLIGSEELLQYVPDARSFCCVDTVQVCNLDSTNMKPAHWLLMAAEIQKNYAQYDGFVICHGTDTMAFTAAALSYLVQNSGKPVIITGAQKPIDMEVTDAKTNLLDSLRYASCPEAGGVSIVFDGKVIAGTRARKMRTKSYNAFSSINYPTVAIIQEGKIVHYILDKPTAAPVFYSTLNERVLLLKLIPGMNPEILSALGERYDAVILESYGVGGIPNEGAYSFLDAVEALIQKGKIIVMATQVIHEGSDMTVYKVGHFAKRQFELLETYDMTLESTVTKLMWILGQTNDPAEIRRLFHTTINHDMLFQ